MLLDLCGTVSLESGRASAPFQPQAAPERGDDWGEAGYPAFLLAEAFAQVACRAAQALAPLAARRYLPATTRRLAVLAPLDEAPQDCRLVAEPCRLRPLPEFTCSLVDRGNATLARATVTVAAGPEAAP